MIAGRVTADREPLIPILVCGPGGTHAGDAIVDSGFNGWLTLSPDLINALGLRWLRAGRAALADGRETLFDVYEATLEWDGINLTIPVDESDADPLVGMRLMDGYELRIEATVGGAVSLCRLEQGR